MGGCCCCASRRTQLHTAPAYYYYPRALDERVPLAANHGPGSVNSTGLLVDTNLHTSIPDAYRPPPTPMPFDAPLGHTSGPPETCLIKNDGTVPTTNSGPVQEAAGVDTRETSEKCEDSKELDEKGHAKLDVDSGKELEVELSKSIEPLLQVEEEDTCPICLEEYDLENPRLLTQCEHHFHLACILEWMERSEVCPVCDKEVAIDSPID